MVTKFDKAVEFATNHIDGYLDSGVFRFMESATRSSALGLHDKDFNWEKELEKSKEDYDSFDRVKRYCADLIRRQKPLPELLRMFVAAYLDDALRPPNREKGAPITGKETNMFLPQLVHRVSINYQLTPTRNYESDNKNSACDAVSIAINKFPNPKPKSLQASSYESLSKHYTRAKKQGSLVGK